jgi:hypothetical protein
MSGATNIDTINNNYNKECLRMNGVVAARNDPQHVLWFWSSQGYNNNSARPAVLVRGHVLKLNRKQEDISIIYSIILRINKYLITSQNYSLYKSHVEFEKSYQN